MIRQILEAIQEVELDITPEFKKKPDEHLLKPDGNKMLIAVNNMLMGREWHVAEVEYEEMNSMVAGSESMASTWRKDGLPHWWIVVRDTGVWNKQGAWQSDRNVVSIVASTSGTAGDFMLTGDKVSLIELTHIIQEIDKTSYADYDGTAGGPTDAQADAGTKYGVIHDDLVANGWTLRTEDEGYYLDDDEYADTEEPGGTYWEKWRHDKDSGRYIGLTWEDDGPIMVKYMMSPGMPTQWIKEDPDEAWMDEMLSAITKD